jgi:hypothetical protein
VNTCPKWRSVVTVQSGVNRLSASLIGAHGGFDPKKTIDTATTKRSDGGFDLSFEKDLEPGEYLITTEVHPRQAYDFGIQAGAVSSK